MFRIGVLLVGVASAVVAGASRSAAHTSVRAPARDSVLPWMLRQRRVIGGERDQRMALVRLFPQDVAADDRDRLYVLDRTENRVVIFDARGEQVGAVGRIGDGPGELRSPTALGVTASGQLAVADSRKRAIVRFSEQGAVLPELSTHTWGLVQRLVPLARASFLIVTTQRDSVQVLRVDDGQTRRVVAIASPAQRAVDWSRCDVIGQRSEPLLSPQLLFAAAGQQMAYNADGAYAITFLREEGAPPVRVTRQISTVRATPTMVRKLMGDSMRIVTPAHACTIPIEQLIVQAGIAPTVPAYSRLVMDRTARVWAMRTSAPNEPTLADIYTAALGYIGTVRLNQSRPVAFLASGALVSLEKDDADVPMVVIYDVVGR